jgi:pimeloyl-[acyl-carrier protein] synthase
LSLLTDAEARGMLSSTELQATCLSMLVGGHETTTGLIANGLLALLRNRDQLQSLRENPALIATAVEELLRYDSPIQLTARVALDDLSLNDRSIRKGQLVECWIGSANRDPEQFANPDRLDLRRAPNHHLAFSCGAHFCLGAALARLEGRIAIEAMVRSFPDLRLASEDVQWRQSVIFRCPTTLEVLL